MNTQQYRFQRTYENRASEVCPVAAGGGRGELIESLIESLDGVARGDSSPL